MLPLGVTYSTPAVAFEGVATPPDTETFSRPLLNAPRFTAFAGPFADWDTK
jgi:hypothetical protein